MPDFNSFFAAIKGQESGGSYSAINPQTGALGAYQILPSNVPGWSQQYLGQSWTPQQFLNDPAKQDALAKAVLSSYYDQYGARGAASAWYSGNPGLANDYNSQSGGPSIGSYVDQVMARMVGGSAASAIHSLFVNNDANTLNQQNATVNQPKSDSGMGAVSQNGADTLTLDSMGAVGSPGAQAVGETKPQDLLGQNSGGTQSQATSSTPSNARTEGGTLRLFAISQAKNYLGVPYVFGGGGSQGPSSSALAHGNYGQVGFDCSGLVQYVLAQAGINAPRLSYDQLAMGTRAPINSLQAGDLIGFGNGEHVAVYLGDGQILEAPHTGASVRIRSLDPNEDAWGVSLANLYH